MHKIKIIVCFLLISAFFSPLLAVSTTQIDSIRGKEAIADADTAIIEEYLADAFAELTMKTDFSDVSVLRNAIVSKSTSTNPNSKIMYDAKYAAAFQKELKDAYSKANETKDAQLKNLLTANLLILSCDMGNAEIAKSALDFLQNPSSLIRYWAAKNFENGNTIKQLNEGDATERKNTCVKILAAAKTEKSPEILAVYATFAGAIKDSGGNDILAAIVQKRLDQYIAWTVTNEICEDAILKSLAERAKTEPESIKTTARAFASLLSVAIQRYAGGGQAIDDTSRGYLASVIVQSDKYMPTFLPDWSGNFKRAIEKDVASLMAEHDSAFGSASGSGKMPTAIGFDYDGATKTAPPALTKPAK